MMDSVFYALWKFNYTSDDRSVGLEEGCVDISG